MRRFAPLLFALAACRDGGLAIGNDDAAVASDLSLACRMGVRDKVDILFMVDDSGGTTPKAVALRTRFPDLIKVLDDFAAVGNKASYHFGVVTSDLGAPGISCGKNRGAKLQQVGAGSSSGCLGPVGNNFILYDQKTGENNLPTGQDLPTTFGCMANVGDKGCGFEMPLEAVYRALHDPIAENQGFLREDAILVVVFLTDEDDCSADPTSDLFTANPAYGPLNSFRCTRFGISCDGALVSDTPQMYATCTPATPAQGGKLVDLQKYINFFSATKAKGGVKDDPRDVILGAIDAPSMPFFTQTATGTEVCGTGVSSCATLGHSCISPADANFFGDPAVRINAVLEANLNYRISSICDTDYKSVLSDLGNEIGTARAEGVCSH
jgi:hypothetical protein